MKTKLLIFGITGNLGTHRLLPALEKIIKTGDFNDLSIIGISRHGADTTTLLSRIKEPEILKDKLSIYQMDLDNPDEYNKLREYISLAGDEQLIIDLAVPPNVILSIVDFLGSASLNSPNVKILFEKPFGVDFISAENVIKQTAKYYNETQIYRIDHYLAKEMSQNIIAFRGKNALFSSVWNNKFIENIEIIASEQVGIDGRVNLYEQTGALRDVVQGHLMQLLALTLMDIPHNFDWDSLPGFRLDALKQIIPADPKNVSRAQYEGYKEEVKNANSTVETFVSLELTSEHENWIGVPIKLITGKLLSKKTTEIRIKFKQIFEAQSNCLVFHIHPEEGIEIGLFVKKPGYDNEFETQELSFRYPDNIMLPDAYEQVIVDAILSNKSLFTSSEEVLQSWRILQPIQYHWADLDEPLKSYPAGSNIFEI
jgi:glucose-6-phosphate 1-dehydrogenase